MHVALHQAHLEPRTGWAERLTLGLHAVPGLCSGGTHATLSRDRGGTSVELGLSGLVPNRGSEELAEAFCTCEAKVLQSVGTTG